MTVTASHTKLEIYQDAIATQAGPQYFRARRLEFELQRMLRPDYFTPCERALDLGCGIGFKAVLLSQLASNVDGVDLPVPYHGFPGNQTAVEAGRAALGAAGIKNVSLYAEDIAGFTKKAADSYDLIVSDYLMEHVPDLPGLIHQMARALRAGGRTVHAVPNTHEALLQLAQANLENYGPRFLRTLRQYIQRWTGRGSRRHEKITAHGWMVPITHSEYIDDYRHQFEIYTLESYVFSMIEAGLVIDAIHPTRERTFTIFARKRES